MGKRLKPFDSDEELDKALKIQADELIAADLTYGLFSKILDLTKQHKSVYAKGWLFWLNITEALMNHAVLAVCRIYDEDGRTSGLPVILRRLTVDPRRRPVTLIQDLKLVIPSDPTVKRLVEWRNEMLAHTNYERAAGIRKIEQNRLLLHKDVTSLIDRGMDIYSRYSGKSMSRDINMHWVPTKEAEFVFTAVQEM